MKRFLPYVLIVALLIVIGVLYIYHTPNQAETEKNIYIAHAHNDSATAQLTPKQKLNSSQSITLNAIGDILVHSPVYNHAKTHDGYDFKPMFEPIKPYLESADITIANQETILGGEELGLSSYPAFNSPYEVADALQYAGVDIVSMANNHTLDRGEQAILNAVDYLDHIGMKYVGAYRSEEDRSQHRIISKNDISVGFLSYTYGTNGIQVPNGKEYLVNYIDQEQMLADMEQLENETDFIVVSMHFGSEYEPLPNDEQIFLTDLLSNNGADVIIGHHPHVLQPVDWISVEGSHDRFVNYSLGNFLSNQEGINRNIGAIAQVKLTKEEHDGKTSYTVSDAKLMPTYNFSKDQPTFDIVPLADGVQYELENAEQLYEDTVNHLKSFTDQIEVMSHFDSVQ